MVKRVLILAAHPDDAEFYAGGSIGKFVNAGAEVIYVIATDGSRGSFRHTASELIAIRREESERAAEVMGVAPPIMLGNMDTGLSGLPPGQLREQFVLAIREHEPQVVFTHDPADRLEVHTDHRAVASAASEAINLAGLPLVHPEHIQAGFPPHFVPEKFFFGNDPQLWDKFIEVDDTFELKMRAIAAHESQISFLAEDFSRQADVAGLQMAEILEGGDDEPMRLIAWAMESRAEAVGPSAGSRLGEGFRYQRFHPIIENILKAGAN